jgi:NAD(P)-dependent dehydrogenase (short-subunit alcohol dehydrogenase family)
MAFLPMLRFLVATVVAARSSHGAEGVAIAERRRVPATGAASGAGVAARPPGRTPLSSSARAATAKAPGARRGAARALLAGLAEAGAPERLDAEAAGAFGGLDALVSNAGFADRPPVEEPDTAAFARRRDATALAFLHLDRIAAPHLRAGRGSRGGGRVVLRGARVPRAGAGVPRLRRGRGGAGSLGARPGGRVGAPRDHGERGGAGLHAQGPRRARGAGPAADGERAARVPPRRLGVPEEVAAAATFFLSPGAAYITGQTLHVDGGITA